MHFVYLLDFYLDFINVIFFFNYFIVGAFMQNFSLISQLSTEFWVFEFFFVWLVGLGGFLWVR